MQHDTIEDCLLIAGNNSNWSEQEQEEILNKAVQKYLQKKWKAKIVDATKENINATTYIDQLENNDLSSVSSSSNEYSDMGVYSEQSVSL